MLRTFSASTSEDVGATKRAKASTSSSTRPEDKGRSVYGISHDDPMGMKSLACIALDGVILIMRAMGIMHVEWWRLWIVLMSKNGSGSNDCGWY